MRIAYLVTEYPAVSHTFIRREIHALEALGVEVDRFTIRTQRSGPVKDPVDVAEAAKTRVILGVGREGLMAAVAREAASNPVRFARALNLAVRCGARSERGLPHHTAYLAEACVLRPWLEERGIEHLHAHFGTNSAMVAMLCHELGGPTFSFTSHGPDEYDKPKLIHLGVKAERASFVAVVSSFGRSQMFRWARSEDWTKVHIVRCGVDSSFLDVPPSPVPATPRLVCVGRISEQKGQILLVRAVAEIAHKGTPIELVLVGDGEMRNEIEALTRSERIEHCVRITGWADGPTVRREILAARAFVLPSFAEGLPVAIMEALALGRPVVSTYVAGIPELVVPGETGWLVPAGSIDAVIPAFEAVLASDPARLTAMGESGRKRVREQHDVRVPAAKLKRLFEESIRTGSARVAVPGRD